MRERKGPGCPSCVRDNAASCRYNGVPKSSGGRERIRFILISVQPSRACRLGNNRRGFARAPSAIPGAGALSGPRRYPPPRPRPVKLGSGDVANGGLPRGTRGILSSLRSRSLLTELPEGRGYKVWNGARNSSPLRYTRRRLCRAEGVVGCGGGRGRGARYKHELLETPSVIWEPGLHRLYIRVYNRGSPCISMQYQRAGGE